MLEFKHPDMLVGFIILLAAAVPAIFLARTRETVWKIYSIELPMLAAVLALLAAAKPALSIHSAARRIIVALDDSPAASTAPWHDSQWLREFLQKHLPPHIHITLVKFVSHPHIIAASLLPGTVPVRPLRAAVNRDLPASTKRLLEYSGTTPCWIFTTGLLRWQLPGHITAPVASVAATVVPPAQSDVGITNVGVVYHQGMAATPARGKQPTAQLQITLHSTGSAAAMLVERVGSSVLYETRLRFAHAGSKVVLLPALALPAGPHGSEITVVIDDHDPWSGDNQASIEIPALGQPHALIITRHPGGDATAIPGWISDELSPALHPLSLNAMAHFQAVVLDNIPRSSLSAGAESKLSRYVYKTGGGLLIIGTQHAFGPGGYGLPHGNTDMTSMLEKLSPLSCLPPRPKPLHIVFLLDASGSMDNITASGRTRFGLAAHGICTAVQLLRPQDRIAVLLFSGTTRQLVSGTVKTVRSALPTLLARIVPTGPTRPNSALPLLRDLLTNKALLVVVTDGRIPHLNVTAWQRLLLDHAVHLTIVAPRQSSPAVRKLLTAKRATHFVSRHFGQWAGFLRTALARQVSGRTHHSDLPWFSKPLHLRSVTRQWDRVYLKPNATLVAQSATHPLAAIWRRGLGKVAAIAFSADGAAAGILRSSLLNMVRAPAGNSNFEITSYRKTRHWRVQVQAMEHGNFLNQQQLGLTVVQRHKKILDIPLPQIGPGIYFTKLPQRIGVFSATVWRITGQGKQQRRKFVGQLNPPQLPNRYFPATGRSEPCPWPTATVIPVTTTRVWQPTTGGDEFNLSGLLWALAGLTALTAIMLANTSHWRR
ncbi:MAG: VWA domain-containing protein [Phycisphaerae bacterium]